MITVYDSVKWYKELIKEAKKPQTSLNKSFGVFTNKVSIGDLYFFSYDPKNKLTLEYYDSAPLVICFNVVEDGFYGLNLHYLPPLLRSKVLGKLTLYMNAKALTEQQKKNLSWKIIQNLLQDKIAKACVKKYLTNNLTSKVMKVNSQQWNKVVALPVQNFVGKQQNKIYKQLGLL